MNITKLRTKNIKFSHNKLSKKHVAVIGVGALGSRSAELLAKNGIKKLTVIDRDFVELRNLENQILYTKSDIGVPKAIAAKKRIHHIHPKVKINAMVDDFNFKNAWKLLKDIDLVVDGTDNLESRFLINDICIKNKIPWVYGGVIGSVGASFNILPEKICFRCVFREIPRTEDLETCESAGISNSLPSIIASIQIREALKILSIGKAPKKIFRVDMLNDTFESLHINKNPKCETCVKKNFVFLNGTIGSKITRMCGQNSFQINTDTRINNFKNISDRLKKSGEVYYNKYLLHFKSGDKQISLYKNGRSIVSGVKSEDQAKTIFVKYMGS